METAPKTRVRTAFKITVAGLASIVIVLGGLLAALFLLDWNIVKGRFENIASASLARTVVIEDLDIDLGPGAIIEIRLKNTQIGNTGWGEGETLMTAAEATGALRIWPLFRGDLVFAHIGLLEPDLNLEAERDGRVNWILGDPNGTMEETKLPAIEHVWIKDGAIAYRDALRALNLKGKIATTETDSPGDSKLVLALNGSLLDGPMSLYLTGGSLLQLQESVRPYPLDLKITTGQTVFQYQGTVEEPLQLSDFAGKLTIQGPSLSEIFTLLAIPLPMTPPYRLAGALSRRGDIWDLSNFSGVVGDSDLSGVLKFDLSKKKPLMTGDLKSKKLDFADLAGLIGAQPGTDALADKAQNDNAADESIFPDVPLADERLHTMNMNVTFAGEEVIARSVPITRIATRVELTDGRVLLKPLSLSVAGGNISGEIALSARQEIPSADADLSFESLDLKPFFRQTRWVQEMGGRFSGKLYMLGVGQSFDEMMATAQGKGWIAIRDGTISHLIVELIGLDVAQSLGLLITGDRTIPIRCGRLDIAASDGLLTVRRAILDTSDSVLVARGVANLASETLDFRVEARAKDFSLIDISAPVALRGKFSDPSPSIGGIDFFPFLKMGKAKNLNCDQLVAGNIERWQIKD